MAWNILQSKHETQRNTTICAARRARQIGAGQAMSVLQVSDPSCVTAARATA